MGRKQVWLPGGLTALSLLLHPAGGSLGPPQLATDTTADEPAGSVADTTTLTPDWGAWSLWSACSRSCESGLQRRERVCLNATGGCVGAPLGWRLCGVDPCPQTVPSWHQEQCNRLKSQGSDPISSWEAVESGAADSAAPCRLHCRLVGGGGITGTEAITAEDGTRCGAASGGLAVCVAGRCEAVGCDLEVASGRSLDRCGVCGGNGTACSAESAYRWERVRLSRCSASCGGGTRMVRWVCRDGRSGEEVAAGLCPQRDKPRVQLDACNTDACPPRWEVSEWSRCTSECTGLRTRTVRCLSDVKSARVQVDEKSCPGEKPPETEPCSVPSCPAWAMGHWSQCSAQCGDGVQEREVECKTASGERRSDCPGVRPPSRQLCRSPCSPAPELSSGAMMHHKEDQKKDGKEVEEEERIQERESEEEEEEDEVDEPEHQEAAPAGLRAAADRQQELATWGQRISHAQHIEDRKQAKTFPSFLVGEWSACSATCGEGIRWRRVECKILLEFSGTVATLPDKECPGLKPAETEICIQAPSCGRSLDTTFHSQNLPVEPPLLLPLLQEKDHGEQEEEVEQQEQPYQEPTYAWKITGYTDCTASCLGGLQESIVTCVDSVKEVAVAPYFCDPNNRLDIEVRACNEKPCPPRWNVSDFSSCSRTCGGGNQNRTVDCIQEVAHGDRNVIRLAGSECPQPPPRAQQFCNVIDCPVDWDVGPWTKCSARCGTGRQYRKVRCRQVLSLGQAIDRAERECQGPRPQGEEQCTGTDCSQPQLPTIRESKGQNYVQSDPQQRLVKLKVGGRAKVFRGTSLKIRCPVKHFAKTEIIWAKGEQLYSGRKKKGRHAKISVSRKGILKIKDIDYKEAGKYTCLASKTKADIEITLMEVEERRKQRPMAAAGDDDRLLRSSSDRWIPVLPDDGMTADTITLGEAEGDKKTTARGRENEVMDSTKQSLRKNKKEQEEAEEEDYMYWDSISNHVATGDTRAEKKKLPAYHHIRHGENKHAGRQKKIKDKNQGPPPLSWSTSPWSPCSQPCRGHQSRSISCRMAFTERADTQSVPDTFCASAGLERPRAVRSCGDDCPAWAHSPWGPCSTADCIAKNTAMRSRSVDCIQGGRTVAASECAGQPRPATTQTCPADECVGIWVLGDWSQCSQACGRSERRRTVSCEWLRGGLAPAQECEAEEPRPSSRMQCEGPPCPGSAPAWGTLPLIQVAGGRGGRHAAGGDGDAFCEDTNKFCSLAKQHGLCASEKYREQCCRTCTRG